MRRAILEQNARYSSLLTGTLGLSSACMLGATFLYALRLRPSHSMESSDSKAKNSFSNSVAFFSWVALNELKLSYYFGETI